MLFYVIFNSNTFQNYLVGKLTTYLSKAFKTEVKMAHLRYSGWTNFTIEKAYFGDEKNDTLFFVDNLQFDLAGADLDSLHFTLTDVKVNNGLCKIQIYPDGSINTDVLFNIYDKSDTLPSATKSTFQLVFKNVECSDTRFRLIYHDEIWEDEGFNPYDIDVHDISFYARNFQIIDDSLHFKIRDLKCKEKCGLVIEKLSSTITLCDKIMRFDDLDLRTPNSTIGNTFVLRYANWDELAEFINHTQMEAQIRNSKVDIQDAALFLPFFSSYHYYANVDADVKGTVSNLKIKNIKAQYANSTLFKGNVTLKGLPNIDETYIEVKADHAETVKSELEKIIDMQLPEQALTLGNIKFNGQFTGFYNDFVSYGLIETSFGKIRTDLNMKLAEENRNTTYSGKLSLINFDLGRFSGSKPLLGYTTLDASIVGVGLDLNSIKANIDSKIQSFEINDYPLSNALIKGSLSKGYFNGKLTINDPNLALQFSGTTDLNADVPVFNFTSKIKNANLKALNLTSDPIYISSEIIGDFSAKDLDNNSGTLNISNTIIKKFDNEYDITKLSIQSSKGTNEFLRINGDFIDTEIRGKYNFATLKTNLYNTFASLAPDYFKVSEIQTMADQNFKFHLILENTETLTKIFLPMLELEKFQISGTYNSARNSLIVDGSTRNFRYENLFFKGTKINFNISNDSGGIGKISLRKLSRNDTLLASNILIHSTLHQNKGILNVNAGDSSSDFFANFKSHVNFYNTSLDVGFDQSRVSLKQLVWNVDKSSIINFSDSTWNIHNLTFYNEDERIALRGFYNTKTSQKDLSIILNQVKLSNINNFASNIKIEFAGLANGVFKYSDENNKQDILTGNLDISSLALDNDTLGDFSLITDFDDKNQRLGISLTSKKSKITNLRAIGFMSLKRNNELNFDVNFDNAELKSFQAFLKDYITIYEGKARLYSKISGPLSSPSITGTLELKNVKTSIDYFRTTYSFSNTINFNKKEIELSPFVLTDSRGKTADAYGKITHTNFSDIYFNLTIDNFKDFQLINTKSRDNDLYYGTVYADGIVTVKGPLSNVVIDVKAKATKGTIIYITPFGPSSSSDEGLVHFINYDTLTNVKDYRPLSLSGFTINVSAISTPDAEVQIVFDEQSDDKLRAKGNGEVKLLLSRDGSFNMFGDYILEEGEYRFTALDVVSKKFSLQKGSSISWNGDPMNGNLNITGIYKLRTSVNEILSTPGTEGNSNVRIPVDCMMKINGSLQSPTYTFDLNFPDMESNLNGAASNELNAVVNNFRREPDLMNQQIMFLLVTGRFVPLFNTSSQQPSAPIGTNTVSDIISGQASKLVNNVIPGLDVSVDLLLSNNDPTKNRSVLLSASKKFLDNRLEVQGSFATDNSQNNFLAQYNLTRTGNFKTRIFNRFGTDPIYNRNLTLSGIGLYFRKEFDGLNELFRKNNSGSK